MHRRELLTTLGVATAGLVAVTGGEARAQAGGKDDIHERCAKDCYEAARECNEDFHHCFKQVQAGKPGHAKAMHLCVDCADVCATAGGLVARMSPLMAHTCRDAAECCEDLIKECERLNDPEMKDTIEACRACVKSCREMVEAMGGRAGGDR